MSGDRAERFIAALDVGTTKIKCIIFDQNLKIRGEESVDLQLEYPKPGWVEICPHKLYDQVQYVIKSAATKGTVNPASILGMSITTQRCSFLTWDPNNNNVFHKIIVWKDLRADQLVRSWNSSCYFRAFRTGCKILHGVSRNKRYKSGSVLKVMNEQVVMRLVWVLDNIPGIRDKILQNQVKFGTLDTYLIYRLTGGQKHVTDYSNASPTGFFDPYLTDWADWALNMFNIPRSILPQIVPTIGRHFGECTVIPGARIPILAVVSDQSASLFGSCCFTPGSLKVTLGTGAFCDVNTGSKPHASVSGIYPLIAWKDSHGELVYMAEGGVKDNGIVVEWGKSIGLYENVEDSSWIASTVPDTKGVYFCPGFTGLQIPYHDFTATAGFIGVTPSATKAHLTRALLESIAYRVQQLINVILAEREGLEFETIRVDGGVARNNFILQTIANLTGKRVERATCTEMTALGSAFMAGIQAGIWRSKEELEKYYKVEKVFLSNIEEEEKVQKSFIEWERGIERFLKWSKT